MTAQIRRAAPPACLAWPSDGAGGYADTPAAPQPPIEPRWPIASERGRWGVILNPRSFILTPLPGPGRRPFMSFVRHPDYDFRNGRPDLPGLLTYQHPDGYYIQPDHHFTTDLMTNPGPHRWFMPRDRYAIAVIFHDSACNHHGRWVRYDGGSVYKFEPCASIEAARDLGLMMRCQGSWEASAAFVEAMVRRFGPQWGKGV